MRRLRLRGGIRTRNGLRSSGSTGWLWLSYISRVSSSSIPCGGTSGAGQCGGSDADQVFLAERILGVSGVELDDGLDLVVGLDAEREGILSDEECKPFSAGRGGQGPGVLEERGCLDVVDDFGEL